MKKFMFLRRKESYSMTDTILILICLDLAIPFLTLAVMDWGKQEIAGAVINAIFTWYLFINAGRIYTDDELLHKIVLYIQPIVWILLLVNLLL